MARFIFCAILVLFGFRIPELVHAYNLDTINYVQHKHEPNSMFGFSVALHQENSRSWVLVGAPKADTSRIQRGVKQGGAVYRCESTNDNACLIIEFDTMGNQLNEFGDQVDTKSYQWFGATLVSAGINGPVMACAPRYVYHSMKPRSVERVEPVGTCYIAKDNFKEFTEYSPCRTMYYGYHRQGSCQAGFSAAISKDGQRVYIGAPGSWYWQGQVYSINTNAVYPFKPPRDAKFGEGQLFSQSTLQSQLHPKSRVYETKESSAAEDDSYLGYSTITGDFNGDGTQGVAVGMPRGGGLLGKVLILSWDLQMQKNITGEQIGAYFGYAMCVVDVDGDGLDDLIVGAPMYTDYKNNKGDYENGLVYIIYQNVTNKFGLLETRHGLKSKARFGQALTALGDINQDGFGDFAVGAPYDGPNGKGAVYIFHGARGGALKRHSQVIYAEQVEQASTFGFAISGGIDLDGNGYPDLVVGAYESSTAIVFKSRSVVTMEAKAVFESSSKLISIDEKNCVIPRIFKNVSCTIVNFCLKYAGKKVPDYIDFNVSLVLDSKSLRAPRLFFLTDPGEYIKNFTITLYKGREACQKQKVYITDSIVDKLTPLEVELRYDIQSGPLPTRRSKRDILGPVLDQNHDGTVRRDSINIQKNCGPDNICIPDLRLEVQTVEKYLLGSTEPLEVDVLVSNLGEDAFEAAFYMNIPPGLTFNKVTKIGDVTDTTITCNKPTAARILKCDVGNPLSSKKIANFKVLLNYQQQKNMVEPKFAFQMNINSTNPEQNTTTFDNVLGRNITIWMESVLQIQGASDPSEFHFNSSQFLDIKNATREQDIGEQVVHMYNIRNQGLSEIEEAEVFILWSIETNEGEELMYLLDQAEEHGNVQCSYSYDVNPRKLKIDNQLSRKSYFTTYDAKRSSIINPYGHWSQSTHHHGGQSGGGAAGSSSNYSSSSSTHYHSTSSGGSASGGKISGGHVSGGHIIGGGSSGGAISGGAASGGTASSGSVQGGTVTYGTGHVYTEEERRKILEAEQNLESVGDASYIHRQRAQEAANAAAAAAAAGYGHGTHTTYTHTTHEGKPSISYSARWNSSRVYDPNTGEMKTVEFSTEHYGGLSDSASFSSRLNELRQGGQQASRGSHSAGFIRGGNATHMSQSTQSSHSGQSGHASQSGQSGHASQSAQAGQASQAGRVSQTGHTQSGNQGTITYGGYYSAPSGNRYQQNSSGSNINRQNVQNNVNQDISGLASRTSGAQASQSTSSSASSTYSSSGSSSGATNSGLRRMQSQQDGEEPRPDLVAISSGFGKMAQGGGGGLQTSTFDLGINRGSIDSEVRHSGNTQLSSGGSQQASGASHQTSGGSQQAAGGTNGYQVRYYSQGGSADGAAGGASSASEHRSGSSSQSNSGGGGSTYHSSYSTSSGGSGGSSSHSINSKQDPLITDHYYDNAEQSLTPNEQDVNSRFQHYRRFRRDAVDDAILDSIKCNSTKCAALRCVVKQLTKDQDAWIALRMRLVAKTMKKISGHSPLTLSTMAVARVTKLPYIGKPTDATIQTHELFVTAIPEPIIKPDVVPLWIVILAAVAGTLILLLLIFLLYKCGFFNRKRPSDSQERQPLNRNGGYHGDEHL